MTRITVELSGPLFEGQGDRIVEEACKGIQRDVAKAGERMVKSRLNRVLKHQTPHYRTRVTAREQAPGWEVTDQGVIYGHWLEGTGSRNAPVTRFRGYHTFRLATAELNSRAMMIAQGSIVRLVRRLGG